MKFLLFIKIQMKVFKICLSTKWYSVTKVCTAHPLILTLSLVPGGECVPEPHLTFN